jgi:hypothetical protein
MLICDFMCPYFPKNTFGHPTTTHFDLFCLVGAHLRSIGQSENELAEIYIKMKDYEKLETVLTVVSLTAGAARSGPGSDEWLKG